MRLAFPRRYLLFLAVLPLGALASVQFVQPVAGAVLKGGETINLQWKYSKSPEQLESNQFNLHLCAGGNDADTFETLMSLVQQGAIEEITSLSTVIDPKLGGELPNA
ncbi:predicted protein [Uncinocarpus reesii 1704]|uniref:Uncharacterized protein n=1 Tax=Uncinocarpus reesii (strain UAMH 1704) TaxID=336963 RepID=C4JF03_UNCRE|nr:uncharacterized protein UREG_00904 [Uncinocarpus reesii 1704]EEP76056.1 predicted protein [Uncinocarpus reesii 1704]